MCAARRPGTACRAQCRCKPRCEVQVASACMEGAKCLIWAAGVRSDVHQLAPPRPDKWGFSGHCLRKYAPNFVRSQLDSGVPRRWIPHQRPKWKGPALHLQFGNWRANERRRVPGLTITQAPEPVETSHSCCRGNISIIPHTHSVSRRRWPDSRGATQQAAHTHILSHTHARSDRGERSHTCRRGLHGTAQHLCRCQVERLLWTGPPKVGPKVSCWHRNRKAGAALCTVSAVDER